MSPVISTADQATSQAGTSTTLSGLLISDALAGSDPATITAVAGQGTLTAGTTSGLTIVGGHDGSDGTLSASGDLSDINAMLLDGVTYAPTAVNDQLPAQDHVSVTIQDHSGATDSVNFIFNVAGQPDGNGNITLNGTSGKDVIYSTGNNDIMTGGASSDTFVFKPNFGHDTITDYTPGTDVLQFDHTDFANVAALLAATQDDANTHLAVITHDAANTVALNVNTATLQNHQNDIHIV